MHEIHADNVDELTNALREYSEGYVFRGQSKHYIMDDGSVSLRPSFWVNGGPQGCSPPLRSAWVNFARFTLYAITGDYEFGKSHSEAILQHYGWKSFYLDVSKSPAVSAWFASHGYFEEPRICMLEDSRELPLLLRGKSAKFEASTEPGHLYVISTKRLSECGLRFLDLEPIQTEHKRSRPEVQRAGLLGPFDSTPLNNKHIVAHIIAPSNVLLAYASSEGFDELESVFPSPIADPIYAELLSTPWVKLNVETGLQMPAYARSLEIPEYHWKCPRRITGREILFTETSIRELSSRRDGPFADAKFVDIDETDFFFDLYTRDICFTKIRKMLEQTEYLIFELNSVWKRPDLDPDADLSKGLVVQRLDEDLICVMELTVNWSEHDLYGFGCEKGLHYAFDQSSRLERVEHKDDCPCGNEGRHRFHFEALHRIEESIADVLT